MALEMSIEIFYVTPLKEYRDEVFHTGIMARQKKTPLRGPYGSGEEPVELGPCPPTCIEEVDCKRPALLEMDLPASGYILDITVSGDEPIS